MKRFLALILSAAMLLCLVAVPASAEGEVTFTATTVSDVNPGDTVSVDIVIGGADYEAHTMTMNVYYDPDCLTVMSLTNGPAMDELPSGAVPVFDYTTEPGNVALGYMCMTDGFTAHGTFVTISFLVDENCTEDQTIEVSVSGLFYSPLNGDSTSVPFATVNGAIELAEAEPDPTDPADPTDPVDPTDTPVVGDDLDAALNVEGGTLHFVNDDNYPWTTFTDGDRLAAWSGNQGVESSTSTITLYVEVEAGQAISFDYMAWGEGVYTAWDKCVFAIDGAAQFTYGALDNDWTNFTINLSAGAHTLTWTYSKDYMDNPTGDYFAVDNVELVQGEIVDNSALNDALNVDGGELSFDTSSNYPWITVEEGNRFYAMSGNQGIHSSESSIVTTVVAEEGDIVQFEFMAWGEGEYTFWDHCDFLIDGERVLYYGAYNNDWETFSYPLTAGTHSLVWLFSKDYSYSGEGDFFAVDNVYVGEPVHVDSITADDIEVPVNRTETINWTVLPDAAANKSVTFESADTSIATVNENGVVLGVAEGETVITITSVDNPDAVANINVTVVDTGIQAAYFYGISVYDLGETFSGSWITFADYDPSAVTAVASAPDSYAAAYAYGTVYGYTTGGDFYAAPFSDMGNVSIVSSGIYTDGTVVSMAMNYTNGIMYGLDSTNGLLLAIDISTGYADPVGMLDADESLICIAIDENGVGYAIGFDGNLYSFDPETAECSVIGNTGCYVNYVQDMCYDFNNHELYWAQLYSTSSVSFYRVSTKNGAVEDLGMIGGSGMEVCGLFVVPDDEPEAPENVAAEGIKLIPQEMEIRVGETGQFTAVVTPVNASNKTVEWDVDDDSIIVVDQNGLVLALEVGTATVYVTTEDGAHTAYAMVNVIPPLGQYRTG